MKWINSLAFRVWIALSSIVLMGILTISGLYTYRETVDLEDSLKNEAVTSAKMLNSAIGLYMLKEEYLKINPITYAIQSEPNFAYVIVRDKNGTNINQKGDTTIEKNKLLIYKAPLEYFQETVGEVEIALKTTTLEKQKKAIYSDTLLTVIICSIVSVFISYIISNKLLLPIKKLVTGTKQLAAGKRNVEVAIDTSIIEIQELSVEFNKMAQTVENHEKILVSEINKATKDLSEKVAILEVLGNISNSVLEDETKSLQVINSTLTSIKNYISADHFSLAFINQNSLLEIFELDQHEKISSIELKINDTTLERVINTNEIIVHNRIDSENASYYEQMLSHDGMGSLLVLPITAKNKVIGTLNLASHEKQYFTSEIVKKLSVLTNQIALALDRVAAYESLQKSAYHDYLTGLPNFRLFKMTVQDAIEKAEANNKHAAIFFLDLDRFKSVNDTFGHATGDLLLKYISKQMESSLSDEDTVCRIGGDEFTILLPSIDCQDHAIKVVKKLMKTLENPVIIKGYKIQISASIGISFFPESGTDVDSLIKHADRAMYRVKKQGKNNYAIYVSNKDDHSVDQIRLENELRKALIQEEFIVYYQPKINIQSGTLAGVEALIRWKHPENGIIPPGNFIPLAEETGLILPIGEYVLRQACKQSIHWQSIGFPSIPVSVNLSIRQFLQPNLVSVINKIIIETGIKPDDLELEITESMSMDITQSLTILQDLKKLGIKISVDDFGTGYSSLNYLRQLPIDIVKIDKSFVKDLSNNQNNETIVSTIINMAHNLGLSVTAEGTETLEQIQYLQKHKCDNIQGYYLSKPISGKEFEQKFNCFIEKAKKIRQISS